MCEHFAGPIASLAIYAWYSYLASSSNNLQMREVQEWRRPVGVIRDAILLGKLNNPRLSSSIPKLNMVSMKSDQAIVSSQVTYE